MTRESPAGKNGVSTNLTTQATTRHTWTGLTNGQRYRVYVTVCNGAGCSGNGGHAWDVVPAKGPPRKPTGFRLILEDRTTFNLRFDDDATATGWEYRQKLASARDYSAWTSLVVKNTKYLVGSLTPGTSYTFQIRGVNAHGKGAASDPVTRLLPDVPPKVTTLTATPGRYRSSGRFKPQVTLTWDEFPGVFYWQYQRKVAAGPAPSPDENNWIGTSAFRITSPDSIRNVQNGVRYVFWVRANTFAGFGPPSNPAFAVAVLAAPAKPAGLTASDGDAQVRLRWTALATATGWEYRYKTTGDYGDWRYVPGSGYRTSGHLVTGLTNGAAHTFQVRATNVHGNGPASDAASATPTAAPARPAGVTATLGDDQVTLAWTAQAVATSWEYRQKAGGDFGAWITVPQSGPASAGYVVPSLTNNTAYTFEVRARNLRGPGPASDPVTATPRALPVKPAGVTASPGEGRVTLAWTAQAAATSWQYRQKTTGDYGAWQAVPSSGAATAGHVVTGLTDRTAYTFQVRARNAYADGAASDPVTETPGKPAKPANAAAQGGNQRVELSWDKQAVASSWEYRQKTTGAFGNWTAVAASDSSTTGHVVWGLSNGTAYTFEVRATNTLGDGPASDPVTATPALGPPAKPRVTATVSNRQVALSWSAQAVAQTWQYRYQPKGGNYTVWTAVTGSSAATTGVTVGSLTNGTEYTFQVRATNGHGAGPESDEVTVTPVALPAKPANLSGTADVQRVLLQWTGQSRAAGWEYRHRISGGSWTAWTTAATGSFAGGITYVLVSDLSPGAAYDFQVRGVNAAGAGPQSDTITATTLLPLRTPQNLRAVPGNGQVTLIWNRLSDATGYFYRQAEGSGRFRTSSADPTVPLTVEGGVAESYTVTGLTNDVSYTFRVAARFGSGASLRTGPYSTLATATPAALPAKPAGVTATPGDRRVTLGWTAQAAADAWEYRQKTTGAFGNWTAIASSGAATTGHAVTGLSNGTAYTFEVRATNASGDGAASDEVTATPALMRPAKPSGVEATAGDRRVVLSWNAMAGTMGWEYRQKTGSARYTAWMTVPGSGAASTGHTVTNLTPGTEYRFEVRAVSAGGFGFASDPVKATPWAAPLKPAGVTATPGAARVTLAWTAQAGATAWQYRQKTTGAFGAWTAIASSGAATTGHVVTGLSDGTAYTFEVRATNANADGPASDPVTATPGRPPKPAGVAASGGPQRVTLSWTAQAGATGWEYRQKTTGTFGDWTAIASSGAATTGHVVTGLTNDTAYTFEVRARNAGGPGPASGPVTATPRATPLALPAKPAGLAATAVQPSGQDAYVSLGWTPPSGWQSLNWEYRQQAQGGQWSDWTACSPTLSSGTIGCRVNGLTRLTAYTFQVRAANSTGPGPASDSATATTLAGRPPAPAGFRVAAGDGEATLRWQALAGVDYWKWRQQAAGNSFGNWTTLSDGTATSHRVTGLTNGTSYSFQVRAGDDDAGDGPASPARAATPFAKPGKPTGLTAMAGDGQATLSWDALAAASSWEYRFRVGVARFGDWTAGANDGAATRYTVTGLANGKVHTFELRARNAAGTGPKSNMATVTPSALPAKPNLTATPGNGSVALSWAAQSAARSWEYRQTRGAGASDVWRPVPFSSAATTGHTLRGLINYTSYTFQARARNANGAGPASDEVTEIPQTPPPAPQLRANAASRSVHLFWGRVARATGFQVRFRVPVRGQLPAGPWSEWGNVPGGGAATDHRITGLNTRWPYEFQVRAVGAAGTGPAATLNIATDDQGAGYDQKAHGDEWRRPSPSDLGKFG